MTQKISSTNIETSTLISLNGPTIANVSIANSTYVLLDDTAVSNAGGYAVITGTNFVSGAQVLFGNTAAPAVSFVNSTTLNVQVPALTAGSYVMYIQNPDGSTAIKLNAITSSPIPVWVTSSTLTNQVANTPISISLSAPSDSNVSFSVANGSSLPSGTTLASNGLFSGTISTSTETTYNFSVNAIDTENQEALRSFSVTVQVSDQYFANTVLLLNGETTGANSSNTWLQDISTNKFELTVNGDTRPSAFSPYETVWSNFFVASSAHALSAATGADTAPGTGDFCAEFWYYATSTLNQSIFGNLESNTETQWVICFVSGNTIRLQGWNTTYVSGTAGPLNQWNHVAVCRSGNTMSLFINGTRAGTNTVTNNFSGTSNIRVGGPSGLDNFNGYLSNVRFVKGSSVYDPTQTTITVPTSALTNITNTKFLTCQSNRFVDNSTANNGTGYAITLNGSPQVSNFAPFTETDVTTGSGYFDGTGDYLSVADNTALDMGSSDFTIEFWTYLVGTPSTYQAYFAKRTNTGVYGGVELYLTSSRTLNLQATLNGSSWGVDITTTNTVPLNAWTHIAAVRNGNTWVVYINGTVGATSGTVSGTVPDNANAFVIGAGASDGGHVMVSSYIANFRVVKGTAIYTAAFTPPTAPLTVVSNTQLLTLQNRLGENSNRFIDETGFNHIITRNGNVTQGTFTPFSPTGWSNFFGSSTANLKFASNAAFAVGNSNFTVECFVNFNAWASTNQRIFVQGQSGTDNLTIQRDSGANNLIVNIQGSSSISYAWSPNLGQWYHIAVVKSGTGTGQVALYIDGVSVATGTSSTSISQNQVLIGGIDWASSYNIQGYISNLRYTIGAALYTSNFTPSTTPLTTTSQGATASQVEILTCQSNRFVDNSSNGFSMTVNGTTSVQAFSPFTPTATYSAATVGGSAYFDGSGNHLTIPHSSVLSMSGTNDACIELWFYVTTSGVNGILDKSAISGISYPNYSVGITSGNKTNFVLGTSGSPGTLITNISGSANVVINQWNHLVCTRRYVGGAAQNEYRIFLNGVLDAYTTQNNPADARAEPLYIGRTDRLASNDFDGYIFGLRISMTSIPTLYQTSNSTIGTSIFTPPTASPTAIANTSFLCNFANSGVIDYTSKNVLESVGNVRVSTAQTKYGSRSLYFDGTGDRLLLPNNGGLLTLGSGDFTVEMWLYANTVATTWQGLVDWRPSDTSTYPAVVLNTSSILWAKFGGAMITSSAISANTWYHLAICKSGSSTRMFLNGTQTGSTYTDTNNYLSNTTVRIGSTFASEDFNGYIDDLRITKGFARYTANFTPPTSTFLTK